MPNFDCDLYSEKDLIQKAQAAMANAYAPYSKFPVGAVIVTESGKIFSGANVENACYAMGHCAEASAIGAMATAGERKIKTVVLISKANSPIFPCGGCLQKLGEFATPDTQVISQSISGEQKRWKFGELFPEHFDANMIDI